MSEDVAVIAAVRTPFCRSGGRFRASTATELGAIAVRELLAKSGLKRSQVDHLVFGNVAQQVQSANIARLISVKGGLPQQIPAYTVNRNCASGLQAISDGAALIMLGDADVVIVGGVESMSNIPLNFPPEMASFLMQISKAKTTGQRLKAALGFSPKLLYPEIPSLNDPLCGLTMGQTAELIAREFAVDRTQQDRYALQSQQRAAAADKLGYFAEEIIPVALAPEYTTFQQHDDGIRQGQTLESLAALPPAFDRLTGTITAGNSSQVTDGAAALLLMAASKAKALGYTPLGYIRSSVYTGLAPQRMGLGPVFATAKLLQKSGMMLKDFDLIEINEAFAAQVLACQKAFASPAFALKELGRSEPVGELADERLNVNGGAISLGHPLGASGARLVLTLLKELKRRQKQWGLATLCVGGGQGGAMIVEAAK